MRYQRVVCLSKLKIYTETCYILYFRRSVKRTTTLPPRETASERKKNTRRKKLYITEDESFQDIEPLEVSFLKFFYNLSNISFIHFAYCLSV